MRRAGASDIRGAMRVRLEREAAQRPAGLPPADLRLDMLRRRLDELRQRHASMSEEQHEAERALWRAPTHGGVMADRMIDALRHKLSRYPVLLACLEEQLEQSQLDLDNYIRWHGPKNK